MQWNRSTFKAQLRTVGQVFAQIQAKSDNQATSTRAAICSLLQQDNVPLARDKAEKLLQDEQFADLLGELEMHLSVIMDHVQELDPSLPPSPALVEAAASVIYASPYVHSKEFDDVQTHLVACLGLSFARSAASNQDFHVAKRVIALVPKRLASALELDNYIQSIATENKIEWSPPPHRQHMADPLAVILRPGDPPSVIDLQELRKLCFQGLPDSPVWLRPRIWRLLFGMLPTSKPSWRKESTKQREAYYDLARRVLTPFVNLGFPSPDGAQADATLLGAWRQLSGLPPHLFAMLEDAPVMSAQCPLYGDAETDPDPLDLTNSAEVLNRRLSLLQRSSKENVRLSPTPEVRVEEEGPTELPYSTNSALLSPPLSSRTILSPKEFTFGSAHAKHCSALLRLLYLHSTVNPGNISPYSASLLVPLYSVLCQEVDSDDAAHIEADTFWLFEALVAEFGDLHDESSTIWLERLGERIESTNADFYTYLQAHGLDPRLPHYSHRWLTPLLTHTLPLKEVLVAWDSIFAREARSRDCNPKIDHLLDICASMLIRMKPVLLGMGASGKRNPDGTVKQSDNIFRKGMGVLQRYDASTIGGIDRIIQVAFHMAQQRQLEKEGQGRLGLGARLTTNVWQTIVGRNSPQLISPIGSDISTESSESDGEATEHEDRATTSKPLTSRISETVWKGITNQSAMEAEDDDPRMSHQASQDDQMRRVASEGGTSQAGGSSLWSYADKLKESDTLATLSRVSSTWRTKGLLGSWGKGNASPEVPSSPQSGSESPTAHSRHVSEPAESVSSPVELIPRNRFSLLAPRRGTSETTLPPLPKLQPRVPRPLLLASSTVVTPVYQGSPRSSTSSSFAQTPSSGDWNEVMRMKRQHFNKDSYSSVSSLSPSDALGRGPQSSKSDWDSDGGGTSRIVSLKRTSISPMAPSFRKVRSSPGSPNPSPLNQSLSSSPVATFSPLKEDSDEHIPSPLSRRRSSQTSPKHRPNLSLTIGNGGESVDLQNAPHVMQASPKATSPLSRAARTSPLSGSPPPGLTRSSRTRPQRSLPVPQDGRSSPHALVRTPSPSNLTVDWPTEEPEAVTTPRADSFDAKESGRPRSPLRRVRKVSTIAERKNSAEARQVPMGARARKVSGVGPTTPSVGRRKESGEDGDDEGYDDLLSAYESEDLKS